jgi:hypothetical protein
MTGSSNRNTAGLAACCAVILSALTTPALAQDGWRPLFDGRTLDGWTVKINGHEVGDNYRDTFTVANGAIRVSYGGYQDFGQRFGHLFYNTPFKAYRLRLSYRLLDPGLPDAPTWARSNSGVMFHSQSPQSIPKDQLWPVSLEFQFLGRQTAEARPTGAVCTPGTTVTVNGARTQQHCINSTGPTIPNGTWTEAELEVTLAGEVTHRINGQVVHRYGGLELDPADVTTAKLIAAQGGVLALSGGYIALQSEGHPLEFKDIRIQEIPAR